MYHVKYKHRRNYTMKGLKFFLLILFFFYTATPLLADNNLTGFVTPRDMVTANESFSNISLKNNRDSVVTVYGLYVLQYAYVTPGQSCNSATIIYPSTDNITAGAVVTPTMINPGKTVPVGANYLYNMLYQAIYYENIIIPSFPPGCALPGCTWGSDTNQYNWCIYLGALGPVSTSAGYSANVPPSTELASNSGLYNYNLTSIYSYLGPISCNDRTLTCSTLSQQTQDFSY